MSWCTCPSIYFLHGACSLKITVDCLTSKYPSIRHKNLHNCVGLLGPHCKKKELWARPPVLAPVPPQAIHSSPPFAIASRRLGPCLETLLRNWHSCQTPRSVFRSSNGRKSEKNSLYVCHCLGALDWWSGRGNTGAGQDTRDNGHVRQQGDTTHGTTDT